MKKKFEKPSLVKIPQMGIEFCNANCKLVETSLGVSDGYHHQQMSEYAKTIRIKDQTLKYNFLLIWENMQLSKLKMVGHQMVFILFSENNFENYPLPSFFFLFN